MCTSISTHLIAWRNFNCFMFFMLNVSRDRIISMKFMRKYIHVAKDMKPVLTRDAADLIADEYSKLRNQDNLQQESIARVRYFTVHVDMVGSC